MNHYIRVPQVRCIDADGAQIGIVSTSQALSLARQRGLDLVEVSPMAQPPVCRVMDFGKYKFELAKKDKQANKHQAKTRVKEVKFHANTEQHDFDIKVRQIRDFIEEGHRVKVSLMFRGREQAHQELGYEQIRRVIKSCEDISIGDKMPQQLGRILILMLTPRAGLIKPKAPAPAPQPAAPAPGARPAQPAAPGPRPA